MTSKKLPVGLVIPGSPFLTDERVFVSLGILKVAAALERAGHAVEVLDLSGISNPVEAFVAWAKDGWERSGRRYVGFTATTPQMPNVVPLLDAAKAFPFPTKTILGGPHPTLVSAAAKLELKRGRSRRGTEALAKLLSMVDVVVAGDGEKAVLLALEARGLVDADEPRGDLFLKDEELEILPARHLVDLASYRYTIEDTRSCSIIAQLGCPYRCGFCGGRSSPMLRRVRFRSTRSVLDEIETLHVTYGYFGFMFYDDELNVNASVLGDLLTGLADLQGRLGVELRFRGFVKAELFTEKQAAAMHRAGFRWLLCGYESGSPRVLENIQKQATREDNSRCLRIARAAGLKVKALMSLGHAGESPSTIAETESWLLSERPDDFDATIITTYPGTPYYDEAELVPNTEGGASEVWCYEAPKTKDRLYQLEIDHTVVADYYKGDPNGGYRSYVWTPEISREELVRKRDALERHVRAELGIPYPTAAAAKRYEHSMGQGAVRSTGD